MPMIDVYAVEGTFDDKHALAKDLAAAVMRWEQVPNISLFSTNTAAFIHDLPAGALSNVAGDNNYVRVQVLTPVGVLDRTKQLGVVKDLTDIVAAAAGDPTLTARTWVLLTESPEGGWGVSDHANTGDLREEWPNPGPTLAQPPRDEEPGTVRGTADVEDELSSPQPQVLPLRREESALMPQRTTPGDARSVPAGPGEGCH